MVLTHNEEMTIFLILTQPFQEALLASASKSQDGREAFVSSHSFLKSACIIHVYCGTIHNSQVMETAKMSQH
jgi:hypothetical protein